MNFLCRVAGLRLRNRVRSSDIAQSRAAALPRGRPKTPSEELVELAEERNIWISLLKLLPLQP